MGLPSFDRPWVWKIPVPPLPRQTTLLPWLRMQAVASSITRASTPDAVSILLGLADRVHPPTVVVPSEVQVVFGLPFVPSSPSWLPPQQNTLWAPVNRHVKESPAYRVEEPPETLPFGE